MATHIIPVLPTSDDRRRYGITHQSALVYRVMNAPGERRVSFRLHNPEYPHRILVWDNTGRPNTDPETRDEHGRNAGPGRYLDPSRKGTDAETTVRLSSESTAISPNRSRPATGDPRSGQQYAQDVVLTVGDYVILESTEGLSEPYVIRTRPLADPELVPVSLLAASE